MNNDQLKYLADFAKIIAIAQFGYFGYKGLENGNIIMFTMASIETVLFMIAGILVLGLIKEKNNVQ